MNFTNFKNFINFTNFTNFTNFKNFINFTNFTNFKNFINFTNYQLLNPPIPASSNLPGWSAIILFQRTYPTLTAKSSKKPDFFQFLTNFFFNLTLSTFNFVCFVFKGFQLRVLTQRSQR
jgi:hypothetical protein